MRGVLSFLLIITCFGLEAKPPLPTKVEECLRILRHNPNPSLETLKQIGSDVDLVLVELLIDRRQSEEIRVRAARTLGLFRGERSRAVLVELIASREEPKTIRTAAMIGLARCLREDAIGEIKPYLLDKDPHFRIWAARALGEICTPLAKELLLQTIEHEDVLEVRIAMEHSLKGCEKKEER